MNQRIRLCALTLMLAVGEMALGDVFVWTGDCGTTGWFDSCAVPGSDCDPGTAGDQPLFKNNWGRQECGGTNPAEDYPAIGDTVIMAGFIGVVTGVSLTVDTIQSDPGGGGVNLQNAHLTTAGDVEVFEVTLVGGSINIGGTFSPQVFNFQPTTASMFAANGYELEDSTFSGAQHAFNGGPLTLGGTTTWQSGPVTTQGTTTNNGDLFIQATPAQGNRSFSSAMPFINEGSVEAINTDPNSGQATVTFNVEYLQTNAAAATNAGHRVTLRLVGGGDLADGTVTVDDEAILQVSGTHGTNPFFIETDISVAGNGEVQTLFGTSIPQFASPNIGRLRVTTNDLFSIVGSPTFGDLFLPRGEVNGNGLGNATVNETFDVSGTLISRTIRGVAVDVQNEFRWQLGRNFLLRDGALVTVRGAAIIDGTDTFARTLDLGFATPGLFTVTGPNAHLLLDTDVPLKVVGLGAVHLADEATATVTSPADVEISVTFDTEPSTTTIIDGSLTLQDGTGSGAWAITGDLTTSGYSMNAANVQVEAGGTWQAFEPILNQTIVFGKTASQVRFENDTDVDETTLRIDGSFELLDGTLVGTDDAAPANLWENFGLFTIQNAFGITNVATTNSASGTLGMVNSNWEQSTRDFTNHGLLTTSGLSSFTTFDGGVVRNEVGATMEVLDGTTTLSGDIENDGEFIAQSKSAMLELGSLDGSQPAFVQHDGNLTLANGATACIGSGSSVLGTGDISCSSGSTLCAQEATIECTAIVADHSSIDFCGVELVADDFIVEDSDIEFDEGIAILKNFTAVFFLALGEGLTYREVCGFAPPPQVDGATPGMHIIESFTHNMIVESEWLWEPGTVLSLIGGVGAAIDEWDEWTHMEIAGTDSGDVPAGYITNFDLRTLRIGAGAHAYLEDLIDNGNRNGSGGGGEALYVDTLEFEDLSGVLNVNGLHIYYQNLVGDPSQIIDIPVVDTCPADVNDDSVVNVTDLLALLASWGSCPAPCPPTCDADTNGDCVVNVQDLLALLAAWGACP